MRKETIKFLKQIFRCKEKQNGGNQRNKKPRNKRQVDEGARVPAVNTRVTDIQTKLRVVEN